MSILDTVRTKARHRKLTPAEEIARLERENDQLACHVNELGGAYLALRELFDQAGIDLSAVRVDNEDLTRRLRQQAGKVVRRDAEIRRLAASLKNTQRELERVKPRVTKAHNPARIPPYAPADPADWEVIDPAGEAIAFGRWMPFPPDPDGETTVGIALADLLTGRT